jgi:hypothetical protein
VCQLGHLKECVYVVFNDKPMGLMARRRGREQSDEGKLQVTH